MPFVNVKLIKGVFDAEQKQEMIQKLTMVEIEGEAMRPVTWVTVEEVESGHWGIGGKAPPRRTCTTSSPAASAARPRQPRRQPNPVLARRNHR